MAKATNRIGLQSQPVAGSPPPVKTGHIQTTVKAAPKVKPLPQPTFDAEVDDDGQQWLICRVPMRKEAKLSAAGNLTVASLPGKWVGTGLATEAGEICANACFLVFRKSTVADTSINEATRVSKLTPWEQHLAICLAREKLAGNLEGQMSLVDQLRELQPDLNVRNVVYAMSNDISRSHKET